jgi:hypothetical protein
MSGSPSRGVEGATHASSAVGVVLIAAPARIRRANDRAKIALLRPPTLFQRKQADVFSGKVFMRRAELGYVASEI